MRLFLNPILVNVSSMWEDNLYKADTSGTAFMGTVAAKRNLPVSVGQRASGEGERQAGPDVSSPQHQHAAATAIAHRAAHYHAYYTGQGNKEAAKKQAEKLKQAHGHIKFWESKGVTSDQSHHDDWIDHYDSNAHLYSGSSVDHNQRSRWHKIATGTEFSHPEVASTARKDAETVGARMRSGEEPQPWASTLKNRAQRNVWVHSPAEQLGFKRPVEVPVPKLVDKALEALLGSSFGLFKAKDRQQLLQDGYNKAHQRIKESIDYGGDHRAAAHARIKVMTNPHKLAGMYHAAKDYGMKSVSRAASAQIRKMHGHTIRRYPAKNLDRIEPVKIKKVKAPKYPSSPDKGESYGDYRKRVFTHFRTMGRPHKQALAIAYNLGRKHFGSVSTPKKGPPSVPKKKSSSWLSSSDPSKPSSKRSNVLLSLPLYVRI